MVIGRVALTHCGQSHFGLTNASILLRSSRADPVAERSSCGETDAGTDEDGKVHEADALCAEVVGGRGEVLRLCEVEGQVNATRP